MVQQTFSCSRSLRIWGGCQRIGKEVGEHVSCGHILDVDRLLLGLVSKVMVAQVYELSALRWALILCNPYC